MAPARKPEDYTLRITAGPSYDLSTHVELPINSPQLTHIVSDQGMDIDLSVRINNYRGLPKGSPDTSKYFERGVHGYNKDQYSIAMRFTPKPPSSSSSTSRKTTNGSGTGTATTNKDGEEDAQEEGVKGIPASDLQFGNDFDHPIRNYLPPGVNTAMNILKWWIDPGLEGDAYADEPFLYGPALSSFNAVRVGAGDLDGDVGLWVEEGASSSEDEGDDGDDGEIAAGNGNGTAASGNDNPKPEHENNGKSGKPTNSTNPKAVISGKKWREEILHGTGVGNDPKRRQKWALKQDAKEKWIWEYGRTYSVDFFNPYIDFGKCELKLPGFGVNVLRYWDGETGLRYVLRNRLTSKPYLVILFTLYPNDMVNEDGTLKPEALKATARASGGGDTDVKAVGQGGGDGAVKKDGDGFDEEKAVEEAKKKLEGVSLGDGPKGGATGDDDVD
ncbi:hypothetical protein B0T20DRAFT_425473 [Sordaria brevicollis]|uniref:Domain of unknown function at the cortex 1 domain-containing protein n=1 Tax=Sordaria brevicollis TaxID=83679 RepID=A0AAE0NVD3_SORBR|nr:hypothetical protein B0T20DRAFT_425473 [Sordaria brevicollis]